MILPVGTTTAITIGPFVSTSGSLVTTGTPTVTARVNGSTVTPNGSIGSVGSDGCASYTPGASDPLVATAGDVELSATLTGAMPYFRRDQVGPAIANVTQNNGSGIPLALQLTSTGTQADTWSQEGYYLGYPYFIGVSTGKSLWSSGSGAWNISTILGQTPVASIVSTYPWSASTWNDSSTVVSATSAVQNALSGIISNCPSLLGGAADLPQIATAILTDTTSSDYNTANSLGNWAKNALSTGIVPSNLQQVNGVPQTPADIGAAALALAQALIGTATTPVTATSYASSGGNQTFTASQAGQYLVQLWGAGGNGYSGSPYGGGGGGGGSAAAVVTLGAGDNLTFSCASSPFTVKDNAGNIILTAYSGSNSTGTSGGAGGSSSVTSPYLGFAVSGSSGGNHLSNNGGAGGAGGSAASGLVGGIAGGVGGAGDNGTSHTVAQAGTAPGGGGGGSGNTSSTPGSGAAGKMLVTPLLASLPVMAVGTLDPGGQPAGTAAIRTYAPVLNVQITGLGNTLNNGNLYVQNEKLLDLVQFASLVWNTPAANFPIWGIYVNSTAYSVVYTDGSFWYLGVYRSNTGFLFTSSAATGDWGNGMLPPWSPSLTWTINFGSQTVTSITPDFLTSTEQTLMAAIGVAVNSAGNLAPGAAGGLAVQEDSGSVATDAALGVWSVTMTALAALTPGTIGKLFSTIFGGISSSIVRLFGIIAGTGTDSAATNDIQGTAGGASYQNATMSEEYIANNLGGGGGGGGLTPTQASQLAAIANAVATTPIQVRSAINSSGALDLDTGSDYLDADNRSIQFGVPSGYPSLTGSTPTLDITPLIGGLPSPTPSVTVQGTVQTGSFTINGTTYTTILDFPITAAQTSELTNWLPNAYVYRVRSIWTSPAKTIQVVDPSPCTALW